MDLEPGEQWLGLYEVFLLYVGPDLMFTQAASPKVLVDELLGGGGHQVRWLFFALGCRSVVGCCCC